MMSFGVLQRYGILDQVAPGGGPAPLTRLHAEDMQMSMVLTTPSISSQVAVQPGRMRSADDTTDIIMPGVQNCSILVGPVINGLDFAPPAPAGSWLYLYSIWATSLVAPSLIFSQSPVAPALPPPFDKYRKIASVITGLTGTEIISVLQRGDRNLRYYMWDTNNSTFFPTGNRFFSGNTGGVWAPVSYALHCPPSAMLAEISFRTVQPASFRPLGFTASAEETIVAGLILRNYYPNTSQQLEVNVASGSTNLACPSYVEEI